MGEGLIAGRNPVREALLAGRPVERLLVAEGAGGASLAEIVRLAAERGIAVQYADRRRLDRLAEGQVHQGVVAIAAPKAYVPLEEILARAQAQGEPPLLLLLDEVQDPHNLGSLLRSADGAGAHGVVIPKRRSAGLTMTVARTSAGAVEYVPVAQVPNLVQAIRTLKERGLWVVGADMAGEQDLWDADLTGPLAVVIGGEDKGLGRLVRESCDFLIRIPMRGRVNSLNAGVAGAVILFEIARQRRGGGRGRRSG
ncbi:MAG: 23S rRNA (guanosine(2251)-2'-O)-methyltransferase RlmB [Bacillota bacterium]|nr:23S rRNA (guanosine(2251)-2'-O)-methyltransferase RlmB [Bacillota bacterium]REJ33560.1 MAG: 23S rRNA (guanosine(2251)-2'-O)-methyltransferase RlmB [Bacillota bacterium]